jgi:hypothetical protein
VKLYWLSFCDDETGPNCGAFLGVSIVEAPNPDEAMLQSWALGVNPGGEVMICELPDDADARTPPEFIARLLSREDLARLKLCTRRASGLA